MQSLKHLETWIFMILQHSSDLSIPLGTIQLIINL